MTSAKGIIGLLKNSSSEDAALITRAYDFAMRAHEGQKRYSGEPYFIHPVAVAQILIELNADAETIAAALLHDTLEDTSITREEMAAEFGETITFLVDGVTKLGKLRYHGVERHVESLRKFFVAMAADIRVITIRLADRLHNMHTLEHVPKEKQKRIALETLEIYAPLANRLGMWRIKGMLEDAAFPYVYPKEYAEVVRLRKTKGKETLKRLERVYRALETELAKRGLKDIQIDYRVKYLYSLYAKLKRHHMDISQIYDISALRIITDSVEECYQILGIIHSLWRPVPNRLKDYIATPKPNGYQSLHTAIFVGDGSIVEIQIRTREMQAQASFGLAAHVAYHEAGKRSDYNDLPKNIKWIEELINWQQQVKGSDEYLQTLKNKFLSTSIFVFTPKGDVIELPHGATPLDFAYAIHSDIGDHSSGAKVNNKMVSLDYQLKSGDIVAIDTKKSSRPTSKWLDLVKTSMAKKHIRSAVQKLRPVSKN
jgi:GTP diphosphokinase / guanosine-3',5'-bis(diphosphate) 3'-diphosphatase